jgi:hypothetical protein
MAAALLAIALLAIALLAVARLVAALEAARPDRFGMKKMRP